MDYQIFSAHKPFQWIGDELPPNDRTDTLWQCKTCGGSFQSSYQRIKQMKRCPNCCPNRRKTVQDYQGLASQKQLVWSGNILPATAQTPTPWICTRCKFQFENSFSQLKYNVGCPRYHQIVNGAQVSKAQEEICVMLEDVLHCGCTLNEKLFGVSVDITARISGRTIGIFYDSFFWHGEPEAQERDKRLTQKLTNAGISVVRIRSDSQLPSKRCLEMAIEMVIEGENVIVLDMEDWGTKPPRSQKLHSVITQASLQV